MSNNSGQGYYGSINFDALIEGLKSGQLQVIKTEEGRRYVNVNVYVSNTPDKYGNSASISVPLKEEYQSDKNKRLYIGNLKKSEPKIQEAQTEDFNDVVDDDLPF